MIVISDEMLTRAAVEVEQAILNMFPDPSECHYTFSESFERKMRKLIRKAKHYTLHKVLYRAACIFISLFISASMLLAFNGEARAAVLDWIRENLAGVYHYFFVGDAESEEPVTYSPDWVPEGYTLIDSFSADYGETFVYIGDSGELLQYVYVYGSQANPLAVGQGEYELKYVSDGKFFAEVYISLTEGQSNMITWSNDDDKVMMHIAGFIDEDDLIKMAKSVTPKS